MAQVLTHQNSLTTHPLENPEFKGGCKARVQEPLILRGKGRRSC